MNFLSTWQLKDILIFAVLIFNAGGFVWMVKNHLKHVNASLDEIKKDMVAIKERVSNIEGKISKE